VCADDVNLLGRHIDKSEKPVLRISEVVGLEINAERTEVSMSCSQNMG
jgi:hypothetical protein